MHLDDCYTLLDVHPGATDEEMKRAYRDLTKVWHPDRFANDPALRRKAEEKLTIINEAYETILASRAGSAGPREVVRSRTWAVALLAAGLFVLVRRPTPGGLLIALLLFCAALVFFMRMRASNRRR